jgi:nucleotide-binding universal stress UspA family protein
MKILVPVDGSDNSKRAAEYVLKMAKNHPSYEITIVSVACHYDMDYFADMWVSGEEVNAKCDTMYARYLEDIKKIFDDAGVSVKTELLAGEPPKAIIRYVEENGIDKVVMGSRGLSPFKGMVLGSVTYKVLNSVSVPVTIVK